VSKTVTVQDYLIKKDPGKYEPMFKLRDKAIKQAAKKQDESKKLKEEIKELKEENKALKKELNDKVE